MAEKINIIVTEKALDDLQLAIDRVEKLKTFINDAGTPSGNNNYTEQLKKQSKEIKTLTEKIAELELAKKGVIKVETQEIADNQRLNKEIKAAAMANSSLAGAYEKLSRSRTLAKNKLQDLIASEKASTAEIKKAQKEFDVLNKKVGVADKAIGKMSHGMVGLKNITMDLMMAFGVMSGVQIAVGIVKDIYETTKALQSMDLALKMVSDTPLEFAKNQQFVTEVSEKWGLEIKSLQQTFTQFYTASKGLLTDDSVKTTFEGIAKAGSIMGLSLEQQKAAFYAIDQMMSKGTVTAEELKKQLGNAMPGAIKAAAMAYMELHPQIKSIQEAEKGLYADMKKGAIDSATYVPLIAKNFQILYGIESLNSVHTMQAAQNRLQNSWTEWVRGLGQGGTGAKMMVSLMESLAKNLDTVVTVLGVSVTGWLAYKTAVMLANAQTKLLALTTTTATVATAEQTVVTGFQTTAQVANATATNIATTAWQRFNLALKANALGLIIAGLYLAYEGFQYLTKSVEETTAAVKEKNSAFITNREIVTEAVINTESLIDTYETLSKKTKLSKDEQLELNRVTKELAKITPSAVIGVNQYGEAIKLNTETLKKYNIEKEKQLNLERKSAITTEREAIKDLVKDIENKTRILNNLKKYKGQGSVTQELIDSQELALSMQKQELIMSSGRLVSLKGETMAEKNATQAKKDATEAEKKALIKDIDWYDAQIKILKEKEGALSDATGKEGKALQKQIKDLQATRDKIAGEEPKKEKAKKIDKSIEEATEKEFKIKLSNLEREKELIKDLRDNKDTSIEDMLFLDQAFAFKEIQIAQLNYDYQKTDLNKFLTEKENAISESQDRQLKATENFNKEELEKTKEWYKNNPPFFIETPKQKEDREQAEKEKLESFKAQLQAFRTFAGDFADNLGIGDTFDLLLNPDKDGNTLFEKLKKDEATWKDYGLAITTIMQDAYNFINQQSQARFDAEYNRLEEQKNIGLKNAGDSASAKEKIELDYEKKKKEIQKREAKAKKQQSLMNIALDTAQAVMSVLSTGGGTRYADFGISAGLLSGMVIAMGAAQAAMVIAQKIPEYWTGTDNAKEGLALTQERGAEIITDRKGKIKTFGSHKGAVLTRMQSGDKVFNAEESKRMMFENEYRLKATTTNTNNGMTADEMRGIMIETLGGRPTLNISMDGNGLSMAMVKNGNITRQSESRGSGRGIEV